MIQFLFWWLAVFTCLVLLREILRWKVRKEYKEMPTTLKTFYNLIAGPDFIIKSDESDNCDHQTYNVCLCDWCGEDSESTDRWLFTYCPKCGDKLWNTRLKN